MGHTYHRTSLRRAGMCVDVCVYVHMCKHVDVCLLWIVRVARMKFKGSQQTVNTRSLAMYIFRKRVALKYAAHMATNLQQGEVCQQRESLSEGQLHMSTRTHVLAGDDQGGVATQQ
mgnify:CR=1 FL=1